MLELDFSLIVITLLVWSLMMILNRVFFRPIGGVIESRESKIQLDQSRLDSLAQQIQQHTHSLESDLRRGRQQAQALKEQLIKKGELVREQTVAQARQEALTTLAKRMTQMEEEIGAVERQLEKEIPTFSQRLKEILL